MIGDFKADHNLRHRHSALGYPAPAEYAARCGHTHHPWPATSTESGSNTARTQRPGGPVIGDRSPPRLMPISSYSAATRIPVPVWRATRGRLCSRSAVEKAVLSLDAGSFACLSQTASAARHRQPWRWAHNPLRRARISTGRRAAPAGAAHLLVGHPYRMRDERTRDVGAVVASAFAHCWFLRGPLTDRIGR